MKRNLKNQWDDAARAWVDFVRSGKDYYRDELNNPAMFEILGDIFEKKSWIWDVEKGTILE